MSRERDESLLDVLEAIERRLVAIERGQNEIREVLITASDDTATVRARLIELGGRIGEAQQHQERVLTDHAERLRRLEEPARNGTPPGA
jgi:hypothetical protein